MPRETEQSEELNLDDEAGAGKRGGGAVDSNLSDEEELQLDDEGNEIDDDGNILRTAAELEAEAAAAEETDDRGDAHAGTDDEGGDGTGDEELDPDNLAEIASGRARTGEDAHKRIQQLVEENRRLTGALAAVPELIGRMQPPVAKPAVVEEPPAFDFKAKITARNKALLDGEEDKAAALDMEILEARDAITTTKMAKEFAKIQEEANASAEKVLTKREVETVIATAFEEYPALQDDKSDAFKDVMMYRDRYLREGLSLPDALQKAVEKIGPTTLTDEQREDAGAGGKPTIHKRILAARKRAQEEARVARNVRASNAQPPRTGAAGTSTRARQDLSKIDPKDLSDDEFDALPAREKSRMRGD